MLTNDLNNIDREILGSSLSGGLNGAMAGSSLGPLGAGMEFKDRQYGNKFDYLDLIATILGAIPMLILILIPVLIFYFNN